MPCRPASVGVPFRRGCCSTGVNAWWVSHVAALAQQRRPAAAAPPFLEFRRGAARRSAPRSSARSPAVRRAEKQQTSSSSSPGAAPARIASTSPLAAKNIRLPTLVPALGNAVDALGLFGFASREDAIVALDASLRLVGETPREGLLERENLTPEEVHTLAVLLLFGGSSLPAEAQTGRDHAGAQCFSLAMALLHLASASVSTPGGYLPATLTIINMFGADEGSRRASTSISNGSSVGAQMRQSRMYQSAEKAFVRYIGASQRGEAQEADASDRANAFTLAGVLAEAAGDPERAVRWYGAAVATAGVPDSNTPAAADDHPRDPAWDWEARCLCALGRLLPPGAERERALRTAALALGSGEACMLLAAAYQGGGGGGDHEDEIDGLLHQAAVGDTPGAVAMLAAREEQKAALCTAPSQAAEHRQLAAEWRQLAEAAAVGT